MHRARPELSIPCPYIKMSKLKKIMDIELIVPKKK